MVLENNIICHFFVLLSCGPWIAALKVDDETGDWERIWILSGPLWSVGYFVYD